MDRNEPSLKNLFRVRYVDHVVRSCEIDRGNVFFEGIIRGPPKSSCVFLVTLWKL